MDCSKLTVTNHNNYISITYANGIDVYPIYINESFIDDEVKDMVDKNQIEKLIEDYEYKLACLENDLQIWKQELKVLKEKIEE